MGVNCYNQSTCNLSQDRALVLNVIMVTKLKQQYTSIADMIQINISLGLHK